MKTPEIVPLNADRTDLRLDFSEPDLSLHLGATLDLEGAGISFVRVTHGVAGITLKDGTLHALVAGDNALVRHCEVKEVFAKGLRAITTTVRRDPGGEALRHIMPSQPEDPFPVPGHDLLVDGIVPKAQASISLDACNLLAGVWQSTPYHRKSIAFPRHEFMHLLQGSVAFQSPSGQRLTFAAGDSFFVPRGFVADWKQTESVRKVFFIAQASS